MEGMRSDRLNIADSMVLVGISIAVFYWCLESIIHVFVAYDVDFLGRLFSFDFRATWPRMIVFALFLFFSSHVRYTINNRIRAEAARQQSEKKYQTIIETIGDGYFEIDPDGHLTFCNRAMGQILGRDAEEIGGMHYRQLTTESDGGRMAAVFQEVCRTGIPERAFHCLFVTVDGTTRDIEMSVSPRLDGETGSVGLHGIARDISDRRTLERDLIESNENIRKSRAAAIFGLAKLADYRDEETGTHLERIQEFGRIVAEELSKRPPYDTYVTQEYIDDFYLSSLLHDIGKVGVPDSILLKSGKLTEAEFEVVKRHTQLGGDALTAAETHIRGQSSLTLGKEIALNHHEKWDGTGYPAGLKGDAIPLSARIVALADYYDALTSERTYKSAYSHKEAVAIISAERGKHFDPDVVDAFLTHEAEFDRIRGTLRDTRIHSPDLRSLAEDLPKAIVDTD